MIVDFQHHYTPKELFDAKGEGANLSARLDENGNPCYLLNPLLYDLDAHIRMMDGAGIDIAVLGADGAILADGQPGELCSRGVNQLLGYDQDTAAMAALRKYGPDWLATGDVAVRDRDGFYTLIDRIRDIVISGGENIYPSEVESVLRDHPAVADCAVFGVPDARLGEVPVAHVILAEGGSVSAAGLIAHCAAGLARHKTPRSIRIVTGLPRTAIGKVRKNRLRDEYPSGLTMEPGKGVKAP